MNTPDLFNSYFNGFSEISHAELNNPSTNFWATLKILSYLTLVIPLFVILLKMISDLVKVWNTLRAEHLSLDQAALQTEQAGNEQPITSYKEAETTNLEDLKSFDLPIGSVITSSTHILSFPDNSEVTINHYSWGDKYLVITFDSQHPPLILEPTKDPSRPHVYSTEYYSSNLFNESDRDHCKISISYRDLDTISRIRIGEMPFAKILLKCFTKGFHPAYTVTRFTVHNKSIVHMRHYGKEEKPELDTEYDFWNYEYDFEYEENLKSRLRKII